MNFLADPITVFVCDISLRKQLLFKNSTSLKSECYWQEIRYLFLRMWKCGAEISGQEYSFKLFYSIKGTAHWYEKKKKNLFVNDQLQPNNFEVSFQPKESRFPITLPQNLAMLLRDRIDGLNVGSGCRASEFES